MSGASQGGRVAVPGDGHAGGKPMAVTVQATAAEVARTEQPAMRLEARCYSHVEAVILVFMRIQRCSTQVHESHRYQHRAACELKRAEIGCNGRMGI